MVRLAVATLSALALVAALPQPPQVSGVRPDARDTVQAGDPAIDAARLKPFSVVRRLTMTRGDSVRPFGRQSEQLTTVTLDGRTVLLGVLTFDTPNAVTVDSSWIDPETLRPLRMTSTNASRVVSLQFDGARVRGRTTPSQGEAKSLDRDLGVRAFEWNMFGLALSALPLEPGYRATMPVFMDRFDRVVWYSVEVVKDTSLVRSSGAPAPMWEIVATGDSAAPSARFWVSQRHRFADRVLVWEPGISILYARE
jgi:hypothetical protein